MKIWIRVGMEADITQEELKELKSGNRELMLGIIQNAKLSGDTYVPFSDNNDEIYEDGDDYIEFEFWQ